MKKLKYTFSFLLITFFMITSASRSDASEKIKVITTTETLADLVRTVGGAYVDVESLSRGTEDPHFIEAKPSFMVKVRDAKLAVVVGLDLESAWMTNVLKGGRNPALMPGGSGYLDLGQNVTPLEKSAGPVSRADGDVHPLGNPHYYLDPERVRGLLPVIAAKLSELQPDHKNDFENNAKQMSETLSTKLKEWKARVDKSGIKKVITYHKTFNYPLKLFQIDVVGTLEPKPGIAPTTSHIVELIRNAKSENVRCVMNENHFETVAAERVAKESPLYIAKLSTEVGGSAAAKNYVSLIEEIVQGIEACGRFIKK